MTNWLDLYSKRVATVRSTALRDMLQLTEQADVIGFAGGLPASDQFPIERFRAAADLVLKAQARRALQYSPTEGYSPLRQLVASYIKRYGVNIAEENVLITTGSQQATDLIARLVLDPGDGVVIESPTYFGGLQAFDFYNPQYLIVPNDQDGMVVDKLDPIFEKHPKFIYVLPNFQNPGGATLSLERRIELVKLAADKRVAIVEDDPYSMLRYEGENIPPLIVLDSRREGGNGRLYNGNVLYHGTLSKLLAPGLRIGWVIAPAEVIQQLTVLKQGVDLHTSSLTQMIAYEVARDGFLEQHVQRLRDIYCHRRDVMLDAMEKYFPSNVKWTRPQGGLFIFVTLPADISAKAVLAESLKKMVAFVSGEAFYPDNSGDNTFRLTFSNAKPDRIVEGIRRLGDVLKVFCKV